MWLEQSIAREMTMVSTGVQTSELGERCSTCEDARKLHVFHLPGVCMHAQSLCHVQFFATLWTVAHQAPLSMEFSRQEYWRGLQFPPSGNLPNPGIKPTSPESAALAGRFSTTEPRGKPHLSGTRLSTGQISPLCCGPHVRGLIHHTRFFQPARPEQVLLSRGRPGIKN